MPVGRGARVALAAIGALVLGLATLWYATSTSDDDLSRVRKQVDDDAAWSTATSSAENLAGVADVLLAVADEEGCPVDVDPSSRCGGVLRAAAWAQVSAIAALRCTQPYVIDIRRDLADLLDALADGGTGLPSPPPVPKC